MEDIERLGYEVSVLTRVPDLGDGADRLEKAGRHEQYTKDTADYGTPMKGNYSSLNPIRTIGKSRDSRRILTSHVNGDTTSSTLSGINSAVAGFSGQQQSGTGSGSSTRVKYREQGVDELLQLKLLTAIAATDHVPEGATIILATGDGNVGQFNEDGYLGEWLAGFLPVFPS
jgi:hypothetical protein